MLTRRLTSWWITILVVTGLGAADHAAAGATLRDRESGIPADDSLGMVVFPRGDLFWPLLSDPLAEGTFVSYIDNRQSGTFGDRIGSIGIGDRLGLVRWNVPTRGEGLQISATGTVYSQFRLGTRPMQLVNSDYQIGVPVTFRRGHVSWRVRPYHQSSHLGDGSLLDGHTHREDVAFQAVEALVAADLGPLRIYGGGEYHMRGLRLEQDTRLAHGGIEFRQAGSLLAAGAWSRAHFVAGLDVKAQQDLGWTAAWSARAGLEVGRGENAPGRSRNWSLLAEGFSGPLPYGQFDHEKVRYLGIGLHLGI